jgi:hypothetical protein
VIKLSDCKLLNMVRCYSILPKELNNGANLGSDSASKMACLGRQAIYNWVLISLNGSLAARSVYTGVRRPIFGSLSLIGDLVAIAAMNSLYALLALFNRCSYCRSSDSHDIN